MEKRVALLEKALQSASKTASAPATPTPVSSKKGPAPQPPQKPSTRDDDEDDGVDLFASDSEVRYPFHFLNVDIIRS